MNAKNSKELNHHIKTLQELDHPMDIEALVHLLQIMQNGDDTDSDSYDSDKWQAQMGDTSPEKIPDPEPPPSLHSSKDEWLEDVMHTICDDTKPTIKTIIISN